MPRKSLPTLDLVRWRMNRRPEPRRRNHRRKERLPCARREDLVLPPRRGRVISSSGFEELATALIYRPESFQALNLEQIHTMDGPAVGHAFAIAALAQNDAGNILRPLVRFPAF